MLQRSRKEIKLLQAEVSNALKHYSVKKELIENAILHHSNSLPYSVGAKCLLSELLQDVVKLQEDMQATLKAMNECTDVQDCAFNNDSDSDSDTDIM